MAISTLHQKLAQDPGKGCFQSYGGPHPQRGPEKVTGSGGEGLLRLIPAPSPPSAQGLGARTECQAPSSLHTGQVGQASSVGRAAGQQRLDDARALRRPDNGENGDD